MKIVNYLDVTLNDGFYRPYKKSNEETNHMHVNSGHLSSILWQLPMSIEKQVSSLSSSKETFQETVPYYEPQTADTKKSWIIMIQGLQNYLQKRNNKETFYDLTHVLVRQSKQKLVSSFCS